MVGNKNGTYVGRGFVLETDMTAPQQVMTVNSTYTGILNSNGSPEGVLSANPGSIAMDRANGELYEKKSGAGNTGWQLIYSAAPLIVPIVHPGVYPYTTLSTNYVVYVDTSSPRTINLLASPEDGRTYVIKDDTGSAATNNITVTPNSGTIDGAASYTMSVDYGSIEVRYNGSEWSVH